jgi:hypothetical protein
MRGPGRPGWPLPHTSLGWGTRWSCSSGPTGPAACQVASAAIAFAEPDRSSSTLSTSRKQIVQRRFSGVQRYALDANAHRPKLDTRSAALDAADRTPPAA